MRLCLHDDSVVKRTRWNQLLDGANRKHGITKKKKKALERNTGKPLEPPAQVPGAFSETRTPVSGAATGTVAGARRPSGLGTGSFLCSGVPTAAHRIHLHHRQACSRESTHPTLTPTKELMPAMEPDDRSSVT